MKLSDKINQAIHPLFAWRLRQRYRREMRTWERLHPESFGVVSEELRSQYVHLWSKLVPNPYDGWLRLLTKLSGKMDYRFMPADAYYSVVERCLNDCNAANTGIDDKNNICRYVDNEFLPRTIVRYVRGCFFDEGFHCITAKTADAIISQYDGDLIGKAASGTCGGVSVQCFRAGKGLSADFIANNYATYVVQERVVQEPVIASFNPNAANTCRIVTVRRPWDGDISVVACMLRMGAGSQITDNVSSGGACVDVDMNGRLAENGSDPDFAIIDHHPTSGKLFKDVEVPFFADMKNLAVNIAEKVPDYNILGFDMIVRADGRPCVIEVNTSSLAIVMVQMGRPLFGDYTEQMVDWCVEHRNKLDRFNHFRTFY